MHKAFLLPVIKFPLAEEVLTASVEGCHCQKKSKATARKIAPLSKVKKKLMDLPFDNIGITNLVPDDVLNREDVDVINADRFDSDPGNDEERNYRKRRLAELRTEMEGVINASGTGPTGPYSGIKVGPSGSSGPTTRSKKIKNTGTNDDSQASSSFLDAHDKWDLCPWVLVNLDIPVKAIQYQLQRELEVHISMSKAFRAKAKAEREIRDHVLQYSMLTDYRIYVCLGALKLGMVYCGQAYKDLLRRAASATNVRDFEKFGQDGLGGSGVGAVIGLSVAAGEGGTSDPGGAGVASQGLSHTRWTRRRVQTERISPKKRTPTQPASQPSTSSQVPVSQIRNKDGREMGDGVLTQSSAAGGASEWSFL
nr:hypothetical protein [Tanacetum cinerariifolium]